MRKVYISFNSAATVEKNTNEYSIFPKTNTFSATYDGNSVAAAFTSGKGKSALPNYYLYFRDEKGAIFYFRSTPEEIEIAKKGFSIFSAPTTVFPAETPEGSASEVLESNVLGAAEDLETVAETFEVGAPGLKAADGSTVEPARRSRRKG